MEEPIPEKTFGSFRPSQPFLTVLYRVNIPDCQHLPFGSATVSFYPQTDAAGFRNLAPPQHTILITDDTVAALQPELLEGYRVLTVPAGEDSKRLDTVSRLATQLLQLGADRTTLLVGIGGGVITDLTGFVASVFMRGLPFAFVPTTVLAMVDAAWGGKNGVNLDTAKNMLGVIRQPQWVAHLPQTLQTLPETEWSNGFAEIIKYGCISDPDLLHLLEQHALSDFQNQPELLADLVARCVVIKSRVVHEDETETGLRRYLNFGHTLGHAIEWSYHLPHGAAVGLGMLFAARLSAQQNDSLNGLEARLEQLLQRYGLPTRQPIDLDQVITGMQNDKKRLSGTVLFVLLRHLGEAFTERISFNALKTALQNDLRWQ
jgi:3-dehydroquinate synthase